MFYVYVLINPITGLPFYVGKGIGRRAKRHEAEVRSRGKHANPMMLAEIKKIIDAGLKVEIKIENEGLTDDVAKSLEIALISKIGRRNLGTGPLVNLTEGGEGTVGRIFSHSQETKDKISASMTGKIQSLESNEARSASMLGRYSGRKLTTDWKDKISKAMLDKPQTSQKREKISKRQQGENNSAAKTYLMRSPDGDQIEIKSLKTFCQQKHLNYNSLRRGSQSQGWIVLERRIAS